MENKGESDHFLEISREFRDFSDSRGSSRESYCIRSFPGGQRKQITINNFLGLSREWVGVKFVYVLNTSTKFPGNLMKTPGQSRENPWIIPGQSREHCLCVSFFFSWPLQDLERNIGKDVLGNANANAPQSQWKNMADHANPERPKNQRVRNFNWVHA